MTWPSGPAFYKGVYAGNEDTERKPAYHNGTAWTWMFLSFCEAWSKAYGSAGGVAVMPRREDLNHQAIYTVSNQVINL